MTALTPAENRTLAEYEEVIERGIATFVQVGRSLAAIRDRRLYRETHGTFEAYCERRWSLSRSRAYRLIEAAEITEAVSPLGDTPAPSSERQARELSGLPAETAAEVMREAHEETAGKITAKAVREARERITPKPDIGAKIAAELAAADASYAEQAHSHSQPAEDMPSRSDAVADYLAAQPDLQQAKYGLTVFRTALRAREATTYDPVKVASALDDEQVDTIVALAQDFTDWIANVKRARPTGLRVVNGGRR